MKKADNAVLKKWVKMSAIIFAIAYSLNCFVVSKLTIIISNNVIFSDTVVPQLIEYLGEMIELGAISFCYAVLLLVIYKSNIILLCSIAFGDIQMGNARDT